MEIHSWSNDGLDKEYQGGAWSSAEERRMLVQEKVRAGMPFSRLAISLGVSRQTIYRDTHMLDISRWTNISDDELLDRVHAIVKTSHETVGVRNVEGDLCFSGIFVQERRIIWALVMPFIYIYIYIWFPIA